MFPCLFLFGWYDEGTIFSMMHGPEGLEEDFGNGIEPEDLQRLNGEGTTADWDEVRKHFDSTIEKGAPWSTIHGVPPEKT